MAEFRPGGFNILPPVIKNLLIVNTLVFIAQLFQQQDNPVIEKLFALHNIRSPLFEPWQLVTYMFLHGGWEHIIFNMFALWMFGNVLENVWGSARFFIFYMLCRIGAGALNLLIMYYQDPTILEQIY